jgi:DNA-binding winged helix-turn-helix (wHTH) protein
VSSTSQSPHGLRFGIFEIDLDARELKKNGLRVKLQEQPFKILAAMARRAREVIPREELYSELSAHSTYDSKHGLNNAIQKIREVLGDSPENARFIETVAGRGYRFLPEVEFVYKSEPGGNGPPSPAVDRFLLSATEIRQHLLTATSFWELTELRHRADVLISQHPQHPNRYEAHLLREQITRALFVTEDVSIFGRIFRQGLGQELPPEPKTTRVTVYWGLIAILIVISWLSPLSFYFLSRGRPTLAMATLVAVIGLQLTPYVVLLLSRRPALSWFWRVFLAFVVALMIWASLYGWHQVMD